MLSDEEKEALRNFKSEYETCDHYSSDLIIELDDAEIILNLIEKQSKEIEDNKKYIVQLTDEQYRKLVDVIRNEISKEWEAKIKAKIEELEIEQESNREDLKIAINNLIFTNIDKIVDKISINMSVRGILQSLLEKE